MKSFRLSVVCGLSVALSLILAAASWSVGGEEKEKDDSAGSSGKAAKKDSKKSSKKSTAKDEKKAAKKEAPVEKKDEGDEKKDDADKKDDEKKDDGEKAQEPGTTDGDPLDRFTKRTRKSEWKPTDPDEIFIRDNLKEFVHGSIFFDKDGVVTIEYDFTKKLPEYQDDFRPPISPKVPAAFRWSNLEEDHSLGSWPGIRISDKGMSVLNVWFKDDVEASMKFLNGISWSKSQVCAVVFQAKGGKAIGNNYGGQCANFQGGNFLGGAPATEQLGFNDEATITVRLKDGNMEVLRNMKLRRSTKYPAKSFASGRVGFVWGGKLAGTIKELVVKGRIDIPAMLKEMRKPR